MAHNWTAQDVARVGLARKGATLPQKPSKYRNVKTVVNGELFDSKREAAYWQVLLMRVKAGEVRNVERQVRFGLMCPAYGGPTGYLKQVAVYVADFVFEESYLGEHWNQVVADAKGVRTAMYLLKRKWLELQEGIVIREV